MRARASGARRYLLLTPWCLFAIFPVYWMAVTAFKQPRDIYQGPYYVPGVDFTPVVDSWRYIGNEGRDQFFLGLQNSVLFAALSAFFAVVLGAFAAYGLARYRYKLGPFGNDNLSFLIVSQRMMPPIVAVIALYTMFRWAGLLDRRLGMVIVYTWFNLPLTVFLLTDFMKRIPVDIEHAAAVDGYGKLQQIWRVMFPLAMPGMAAAFLLSFFFSWNDFLLALMLTFRKAITLPLVITSWSAQMEPRWWLLAAAGLIAIIPPAIVVLVLDRFMERQVLRGGTR